MKTLEEVINRLGDKIGGMNCFYEGDDETKTLQELQTMYPDSKFPSGHKQMKVGWHIWDRSGEIHIDGVKTPAEAIVQLASKLRIR